MSYLKDVKSRIAEILAKGFMGTAHYNGSRDLRGEDLDSESDMS